ncbi:Carbohydrate binding domain-containing protein [Anaerocolumna jejuensis DSM 15929]|uniref:Carbohydrate binding domain-containing protein n=1 Tax=Anaerocolumna jejuensis DSM 15929 TaxID=1121322 RepID=A0A1M7D7D4_9FIRM|nr:carbohydrate binding domain-containing protein [Anaerocolumna jejuensis]SHL75317.1 Carbohydrate binding domain-containing protein [Anaerocolumna jejuensis DSM 15929]
MRIKKIRLLAIAAAILVAAIVPAEYFITDVQGRTTEKAADSKGYSLVWSDDFSGNTLDASKWNYELHEPGWVNNELQSYTDSSDNVYVKDGNLVIQPIKTENAVTGNTTYTSGRINTRNKADFKYGKIEVKAKLPKGQGIWPAIWMMPAREELYGGWPKCGELDIMELLGNDPAKVYQTLHYSKTGSDVQSQGTKILSSGDFSDAYHVFSMEWEPEKISFYVDGKLTKTETKWYTSTDGVGTITYPAPFDQEFYMILNVAVGGNWPGNPNADTDFSKAKMLVDYVKVYQKPSYDENVVLKEAAVTLREPDADGNYIINSDFSNAEAMDDTDSWFLKTQSGGDAAASIAEHVMTVSLKSEGTVDYAVQAMQAGIPLSKGGKYQLTFEAKADADRAMLLRLDGPDLNYTKYVEDQTVYLTINYQTYTYDFTMNADTDENSRLEFNLGAQKSGNPTAAVQLKHVRLVKTGQLDVAKPVKTSLPNGNYVYNGTFDQGANRLEYWKISANKVNASITVTNTDYVRKLKVQVPAASEKLSASEKQGDVIVEQNGLALKAGESYVLTFDARAGKAKEIQAAVAGKPFTAKLSAQTKHFKFKFSASSGLKANTAALKFLLGKEGTVYIDNVRIEKVTLSGKEMVQNGSFMEGLKDWSPYVDSSAAAVYTAENGRITFNITNPGSQNWHIQLKQSGLFFDKGKTYQVKAVFKSGADRKVELALMGNASKNYAYYGGESIVLTAEKEYNYTGTFTMNGDSDTSGDLVFSFGKTGGTETPAGTVELTGVSVIEIK